MNVVKKIWLSNRTKNGAVSDITIDIDEFKAFLGIMIIINIF